MPPKNTPEIEKPADETKIDPVEKLRADVEPKTDPLAAVEAVIAGQAAVFKAAAEKGDVEAHEIASQFEAKAHDLAVAALANVESFGKGFDRAEAPMGGVAAADRDQPHGLRSPMAPAATLQDEVPHNQHVVDAASEQGMDPLLAHQMSTHGSNV